MSRSSFAAPAGVPSIASLARNSDNIIARPEGAGPGRRPSLAPIASPYCVHGKDTRPGEAFQERPGEADARQGGAAGPAADRAGTGEAAQSGDRARRSRPGLADRAEAAAGQFL